MKSFLHSKIRNSQVGLRECSRREFLSKKINKKHLGRFKPPIKTKVNVMRTLAEGKMVTQDVRLTMDSYIEDSAY